MLFEKTEHNYIFIFILWGISIAFEMFFYHAKQSNELKQWLQLNIQFVPQFQMLAYSGYLTLYLFLKTRNNILVPKLRCSKMNLFRYAVIALASFSTAFTDLVMITVTTFSVFNVAYGIGDNIPLNWHMPFVHAIFPLLALFLVYILRNTKLEFRESEETKFGIFAHTMKITT
jgi:hypothetical protein